MQMTITNVSGVTINTPAVGGSGISPDAAGGSLSYPLPYPFSHSGPLATGIARTLPVHAADFRYKSVPWLPLGPSEEWQGLVQGGIVTITFAADGNDVEDSMLASL